jgi:hypothetical protein
MDVTAQDENPEGVRVQKTGLSQFRRGGLLRLGSAAAIINPGQRGVQCYLTGSQSY